MEFRLAKEQEKEIILAMYDGERFTPHCAWDEVYPTMDNITADMAAGNLFVLEDNRQIVGSIAVNRENEIVDEPLYSSQDAAEFGRVIVSRNARGKGYGKLLVQNMEKEIARRGIHHVHILVYQNSIIAARMYQSLGYVKRGEKVFSDIPFILFEKDV